VWALETGTPLEGFGSWTLKAAAKEAGAEPDECYILGEPSAKDRPDLAIEVEWSRGGLSKRTIYERLGIGELWLLDRSERVEIYVLENDRYVRARKSPLLAKLDVEWLASFLEHPTQTKAVIALRDRMRRPARSRRR